MGYFGELLADRLLSKTAMALFLTLQVLFVFLFTESLKVFVTFFLFLTFYIKPGGEAILRNGSSFSCSRVRFQTISPEAIFN